jgi:hypothetical protein
MYKVTVKPRNNNLLIINRKLICHPRTCIYITITSSLTITTTIPDLKPLLHTTLVQLGYFLWDLMNHSEQLKKKMKQTGIKTDVPLLVVCFFRIHEPNLVK